ncbi:MAG: crosslink repair DNA glycosylase YcaQ family protein [Anaerolineae bacterium]|nr:winged helix DNA-binding domain-containing protein [Anaerolineae bacterium]MDW8098882.1 crosslink repair DNA glycosylase YcaQ family protein [Anaerolineae bacterium]
MPILSLDQLQAYRIRTFRLLPELRLRSQADAIAFVNERGFVYFWPIRGITLPSLWVAVAGDRPVAAEHDDPGHVTWRWKDDLLDKRQWYYAKVLRGKATMISLEVVPYFYALSENYGDPEHDYLELYEDGRLSLAAKLIYEALLSEGPLDTVNLRRAIRMTSRSSDSPFERGLTELQRDFKILPVGVAETGAWRYSFVYELVHRYYPDLPEAACPITRKAARQKLASLYLDSVGAATADDLCRLFQWEAEEALATLRGLVSSGQAQPGYQLPNQPDEHFVTIKLLSSIAT